MPKVQPGQNSSSPHVPFFSSLLLQLSHKIIKDPSSSEFHSLKTLKLALFLKSESFPRLVWKKTRGVTCEHLDRISSGRMFPGFFTLTHQSLLPDPVGARLHATQSSDGEPGTSPSLPVCDARPPFTAGRVPVTENRLLQLLSSHPPLANEEAIAAAGKRLSLKHLQSVRRKEESVLLG